MLALLRIGPTSIRFLLRKCQSSPPESAIQGSMQWRNISTGVMCQLYFPAAAADSNSICGVTLQEPFWDCPKPGPGLIWAMDLNVLVSAVAAGAICNMRNPSRAAGNDPDLA